MKEIKDNLLNWKFWVSVGIVAVAVVAFLYPLIWGWFQKFKAKATAAVVALGFLALSLNSQAVTDHSVAIPGLSPVVASTPAFTPHLTLQNCALILLVGCVAFGVGFAAKKTKASVIVSAAILCLGIGSLFAADYVERKISTLIIYAGRGVDSTNGFIRLVSPNGSNYLRWQTNGVLQVFGANGLVSGFTGTTLLSNGNVVATQHWFGGLFMGTNGSTPAAF